jgi:hypothetical protein
MDAIANVEETVRLLRSLEREGFEHEAGRLGELIHALAENTESTGSAPSNLDALWLEYEVVA